MLHDWLALVMGTFGALLPIANPFSTAPVFASVTLRFSESRRKQQARQAAIYMASVLLVCLFAGAIILTFFGITLPILRMAGGFVIARVGFGMLSPGQSEEASEETTEEAHHMMDVAFTPIAMPLLSGPGSMAVTISMATAADHWWEYTAVAVGILFTSWVSWVVLRQSTRVVHFLGASGMEALTRVMGFLLVCIGFQFVATGFFEGLTSDRVMDALVQAVERAQQR
jgi:multiple antibiotic resistance protein